MPAEISFLMRRKRLQSLDDMKVSAVSLEDDLIMACKWKREVRTSASQVTSASTSSNLVIQWLMNDVIALKRQAPKASTSYSQPY